MGSGGAASQQPLLLGSKFGDVLLEHKGAEQAHGGSSLCPQSIRKDVSETILTQTLSPKIVWTSDFECKKLKQKVVLSMQAHV